MTVEDFKILLLEAADHVVLPMPRDGEQWRPEDHDGRTYVEALFRDIEEAG